MTFSNQVILTGKVARPPQVHLQPDGTPVVQFLLELDDSKNSSLTSPPRERRGRISKPANTSPGMIHIVAKGQLAQSISMIQSGLHLLVKGRLQERRWKTPEGRHRSLTEVIASELYSDEENEANR
jgi:single-stranded DNA-binding protein